MFAIKFLTYQVINAIITNITVTNNSGCSFFQQCQRPRAATIPTTMACGTRTCDPEFRCRLTPSLRCGSGPAGGSMPAGDRSRFQRRITRKLIGELAQ